MLLNSQNLAFYIVFFYQLLTLKINYILYIIILVYSISNNTFSLKDVHIQKGPFLSF